ncbi:hypothetical protein WISP_78556 [Willisornis vidua]|uniref:Uncharacterized protein n=1 Tax=Willisornis vidua TaxID=1566151 RepID=A0ABQ9D5A0_9PASS|nr:hypothetical protein WISP_78556 [Willisornis vidua]
MQPAMPSPPPNHVPKCHSHSLLNTSRDGVFTASLGILFQYLTTLSMTNFFLISNVHLSWHNLRPIPLVLLLVCLGEESSLHLAITSFQGLVESNEITPHNLLCFRLNNPSSLQLLLIRFAPQTLHQFPCPSLDLVQHLNVFLVVRGPKLNTGFEVWPHQCQVQRDKHFFISSGHPIFDTGQDITGLLGTLLAQVQPLSISTPRSFSSGQPSSHSSPRLSLHGRVVTQVQDLALSPVEPHTINLSPSIQHLQNPLQSLPTLQQINAPIQVALYETE